jgi:hypothetical protein
MDKSFWKRITAQQEGDRPILRAHGLDKPLRRRLPGETRTGHDWQEIDRQIGYLIEHHTDTALSGGVAARRASELLAHFAHGRRPPPTGLVFLIGRLLKVESIPIKYAKKPATLLDAVEYRRANPEASNIKIAREVGANRSTIGRWFKKYPHLFK